jgi:2-polyprenyl-3-methyl-5-hydroxy-6-metoxy-1,4-benzoquinol methylase
MITFTLRFLARDVARRSDPPMSKLDPRESYASRVAQLKTELPYDDAMRAAVGCDFEANGVVERELLIQCGLRPEHFLVDVGCGSGRLAVPLASWLTGRYLGIDIVPELVEYAARHVNRPDWRFEPAAGFTIPAADGEADMVCFFSVLTHLLHEQSYLYLTESRRVLKRGGRIVFTFIEFATPHHWNLFEDSIRHVDDARQPLNVFISRDAIRLWAQHLGLEVELIRESVEPHIPIPHPVRYDDGRTAEGMVALGQSIAVLRVPPAPARIVASRPETASAAPAPATAADSGGPLATRIAAFPRWHYAFDLRGHSTVTPGVTKVKRHARRLSYLFEPLVAACGGSLAGKRVLDLACNAGFWSLHALRRGAAFVQGLEARRMHLEQAELVFEVEGVDSSRFLFVETDLLAAGAEPWGRFDVVLCLGLLYHVNRPVELFARIAATNAQFVVVDTALSKLAGPALELHYETNADPRNALASGFTFWPTGEAVAALAADHGYDARPLEPAFQDWEECEDYRDGARRGFLLTLR